MTSRLLDKSVTFERGTPAKGELGGVSLSFSPAQSGVRAAIWPAPGQVVNNYARRDITVDHQVITAVDLGAKLNDRFVLDGVYYVVVGVGSFGNGGVSRKQFFVHDCTRKVV